MNDTVPGVKKLSKNAAAITGVKEVAGMVVPRPDEGQTLPFSTHAWTRWMQVGRSSRI
jgi:hypothetical protein